MTVINAVLAVLWGPSVQHAAKVAVFLVASAAIAAVEAYFAGSPTIDPTTLIIANLALAFAKRVVDNAKAA